MVIAVKIINENIDKPVAIKLSLVIIVCIDSTIKYITIGNDDTNVAWTICYGYYNYKFLPTNFY